MMSIKYKFMVILVIVFISNMVSAQQWEPLNPENNNLNQNIAETSNTESTKSTATQINIVDESLIQENESGSHEKEHINWLSFSDPETAPLIGNIINFIILLLILYFGFRKSVKSYLISRQANIKDKIDEAVKIKTESEKKYQEYTKKLEELDEELKKLKDEFRIIGENERDKIITHAQLKSEKMLSDVKKVIEQERSHLTEELRKESIEIGIKIAKQILNQKLSSQQKRELIDNYIDSINSEVIDK